MTYAVDSNVILDILYADPKYAQPSTDALKKAATDGELVARDRGFLRKWFTTLKIIDPSQPSAA